MFYYYYNADFTILKMESDGVFLTRLSFTDKSIMSTDKAADIPVFEDAKKWLDIYFSGKAPDFTPALKLTGTDFQMRVWEKLTKIPFGKTVTYGTLAKGIAAETGKERMSAQAIGGAVGKNPIGIIVPCHRVIGSDGSLTGFAGGIKVKKRLLQLEKSF